ncbi:MAG: stage III sporulation protein AC [Clostridiales bacterium]|nr:stage III sporulation protein AC [Clostridiales bacterium]
MSDDFKIILVICDRTSDIVDLGGDMEIIFKLAGIGLITSIVNQILKYCGKEEIASITTLAGLVISLLMVIGLVQDLFDTVKNLFVF